MLGACRLPCPACHGPLPLPRLHLVHPVLPLVRGAHRPTLTSTQPQPLHESVRLCAALPSLIHGLGSSGGSMNPTGVIGAFQRLPTSDSRFTALTALLGELTPYEWRHLHALLGARSFCFDIIAHLPIELVANVFSYLNVSTPYHLQRVSIADSQQQELSF